MFPGGPQETACGSYVENCPCTGGGWVPFYGHFCLPWRPMHCGNSSAGGHSRSQSPAHTKAASHRQRPYAYKTSCAAIEQLGTVREPMDGNCSADSHQKCILSVPAQCRGTKSWRKMRNPVSPSCHPSPSQLCQAVKE